VIFCEIAGVHCGLRIADCGLKVHAASELAQRSRAGFWGLKLAGGAGGSFFGDWLDYFSFIGGNPPNEFGGLWVGGSLLGLIW